VFVNHLCEAKGEQDGEADKPQESFCELVIASGYTPIALDSLEEVFYPMTTPVDRCREWDSHSAVTATRNAGVYSFSGSLSSEASSLGNPRMLCDDLSISSILEQFSFTLSVRMMSKTSMRVSFFSIGLGPLLPLSRVSSEPDY